MGELAYALKMNSVTLPLLNYAEKDSEKDIPWSSKSLRECYRAGAERFGRVRRKPEPGSMRTEGKLVDWGMATASYPANREGARALVMINRGGTVLVRSGTHDLAGQRHLYRDDADCGRCTAPAGVAHPFRAGRHDLPGRNATQCRPPAQYSWKCMSIRSWERSGCRASSTHSQLMGGIVWARSRSSSSTSPVPRVWGEIGITGVAAVIANAMYHATGKRIRDLPITPDKLSDA